MLDRETLGKLVRDVWVEFAREQHDPKPSHLVGWDELDEANKEVDMRIGEAVAEHILSVLTTELSIEEVELFVKPFVSVAWSAYYRLSGKPLPVE